MIPSLLDQVIAARIPAKRELTATQKRKESLDEMLAVMRAHGNVTAQRACELMERSPRVCRDWLEETQTARPGVLVEGASERAEDVGGGEMTRDEYLIRQHEFQPRGMQLPQSKLTPLEVEAIRSAAKQREALRKHIRDKLSNDALARDLGVHVRTIEKVLARESWGHV